MKIARVVYLVFSWLFTLGVLVQVFLAGMVVVARRMGWDAHTSLGHILGGPLLLMLVSMYFGRQPLRIKYLTWALFGVYVLQADVVIFLRTQVPAVSAFHPVFALLDFALGYYLARQAVWMARTSQAPAGAGIPASS